MVGWIRLSRPLLVASLLSVRPADGDQNERLHPSSAVNKVPNESRSPDGYVKTGTATVSNSASVSPGADDLANDYILILIAQSFSWGKDRASARTRLSICAPLNSCCICDTVTSLTNILFTSPCSTSISMACIWGSSYVWYFRT
ncbi:hypothetical protein C8R43DRAFT_73727 [Mycena crocata]|nr:hypothetical protein C8R43DRAFT_73727 [Mycena crocata]